MGKSKVVAEFIIIEKFDIVINFLFAFALKVLYEIFICFIYVWNYLRIITYTDNLPHSRVAVLWGI